MSRIYSILLSIGVFVIAADQWTKFIALEHLRFEGDTREVFSWWSWTLVHNHGAAFGILRNLPDSIRVGFFLVLPLVVLGIFWWFFVRRFEPTEKLGPICMGLVLGGALGNWIDRLRFGYVVDFIDWHYWSSDSCLPLFYHLRNETCHWPVFNVADAAISCATVLLLIYSFVGPQAKAKEKSA
jgi:signal peptidase II